MRSACSGSIVALRPQPQEQLSGGAGIDARLVECVAGDRILAGLEDVGRRQVGP